MDKEKTIKEFVKFVDKLETSLKKSKKEFSVRKENGITVNGEIMDEWINKFMEKDWAMDLVVHFIMNMIGSLVGQDKEYKLEKIKALVDLMYGNMIINKEVLN